MPQSLAKNLVHLIFSTKKRTPWLTTNVRKGLYAYMAGILKQWKSPAIVIGGVADHVHILFSLSKNFSLAKVVEEVKKGRSKWLKQQGPEFRLFYWQAGYGAFSVSQSMVAMVKEYIEDQERHHRRKSFQDEFRAFLKKLPRAVHWAGMFYAFGVWPSSCRSVPASDRCCSPRTNCWRALR